MLGNLNGCVGDQVMVNITGAFGVPGENDNGRRVVNFCTENGLFVSNKYLKHKSLHKYIRVAKSKLEWR